MNLFKVHCIHLWKYHKEISKLRIIKINYFKNKANPSCCGMSLWAPWRWPSTGPSHS
jgi:hypothetical protein